MSFKKSIMLTTTSLAITFALIGVTLASSSPSSTASTASSGQKSSSPRSSWGFGGIGLSSMLNDVISELNTTLIKHSSSKDGTSRSGKSGFGVQNDGVYGMWNPQAGAKFDVLQLIPTLLIVGLGIMLLPVIITCFTQIVTPMAYTHGRKKRDADEASTANFANLLFGNNLNSNLMIGLLNTLENAIEKFGSSSK